MFSKVITNNHQKDTALTVQIKFTPSAS